MTNALHYDYRVTAWRPVVHCICSSSSYSGIVHLYTVLLCLLLYREEEKEIPNQVREGKEREGKGKEGESGERREKEEGEKEREGRGRERERERGEGEKEREKEEERGERIEVERSRLTVNRQGLNISRERTERDRKRLRLSSCLLPTTYRVFSDDPLDLPVRYSREVTERELEESFSKNAGPPLTLWMSKCFDDHYQLHITFSSACVFVCSARLGNSLYATCWRTEHHQALHCRQTISLHSQQRGKR